VHVITFLLFAVIALATAVWGLVPMQARQAPAAGALRSAGPAR
jgi:hypothetical protein